MHYYKRNLGDYSKKSGGLSMLEHGAYTLLIDSCYDREKFPTLIQAIDWCWARSEAEVNAVKFVLSKFFSLEGEVYEQKRIKEELEDYRLKAVKNKEISTEREEKRRQKARTVYGSLPEKHESPPNHKPITNNQEPRTKDNTALTRPEDVTLETWDDFEKLRKAKKAPLTATALAGIRGEVEKAGITLEAALVMACNRGWTSFKASWIKEEQHSARQSIGQNPNKQEALEARNDEVAERFLRE